MAARPARADSRAAGGGQPAAPGGAASTGGSNGGNGAAGGSPPVPAVPSTSGAGASAPPAGPEGEEEPSSRKKEVVRLLQKAEPLLANFSALERRFGLRPDPEPEGFRSDTHVWPSAAVSALMAADKTEINGHLKPMTDLLMEWEGFAVAGGGANGDKHSKRLIGVNRAREVKLIERCIARASLASVFQI